MCIPSQSSDNESSTRERILELIAEEGPINASTIASTLGLTSAGIRRHLTALVDDGLITERGRPGSSPRGRGRPARAFIVTYAGQQALSSGYRDLATDALTYLKHLDPEAVASFADTRFRSLEQDIAPVVVAGETVEERITSLADALTDAGYAASVRPVPGTVMVQLCQGHCPIQAVAAEFPELCEAETAAFARLLGVHVQRLSTMASGMHVCTTNVPTAVPAVPKETK